ncbi:glycoside hydrolase family 16 protein [Flavobacteriaceae bacterium]|nr:glycoside hydrolase family 16 protein [Flavobacteriaceae bacterium]
MKNILLLFGLLFSLFMLNAQERSLVWADEFNGTALNEKDWSFELGDGCPALCGWGNKERQIYTKRNHRLENGMLFIQARKENDRYTSMRISSKGKKEFQYGRFEIRAKLAVGEGVWPAFWLLGSNIDEVGWPMSGEIDVLEYVGRAPQEIFTTLHTQDKNGDFANTKTTHIPKIEQGFHVYAAEWDAKSIAFFVDGVKVYTFAPKEKTAAIWPFDQPFYLLLNLAIGGHFGGPEVDDDIFPQEFIVDYIRVYQ